MFSHINSRPLYLLGFLICAALIGTALYMQYVQYLDPCPLCIFQRIAFIAIGLICLVATFHHPEHFGHKIYGAGIGLSALTGLGLALRQSWLQHNPPDGFAECGPGLETWLETLPVGEIIQKVLTGTGDCADIVWKFLGLSIPEWAALMFLGFIAFSIRQIFYLPKASY